MLTQFCPTCFQDHPAHARRCYRCGTSLDEPLPGDFVDHLIHALGHPEPETRIRAARLLGQVGDGRAVPALCDWATRSSDMGFLEAIADALGALGSPEAVPVLIRLLRESWLSVRVRAARALARIGTPEARAALHQAATQDPSPAVRRVAQSGSSGDAIP